MKARSFIQGSLFALLAGALPAANAAATLGFSIDGGALIICADGDSCDGNATAGVVTYNNSLGDLFDVNVTTGLSKPLLTGNPLVDLNSVNVQSGSGSHTLDILFSDTDFTQLGSFVGSFGGTLTSLGTSGSVTGSAFYSLTNALFAETMLIGSLGPFGNGPFSGSFGGVGVAANPYSVTQRISLSTDGFTIYSGDFELKIPEPGSLALAGLGLLALVGVGRRKAR